MISFFGQLLLFPFYLFYSHVIILMLDLESWYDLQFMQDYLSLRDCVCFIINREILVEKFQFLSIFFRYKYDYVTYLEKKNYDFTYAIMQLTKKMKKISLFKNLLKFMIFQTSAFQYNSLSRSNIKLYPLFIRNVFFFFLLLLVTMRFKYLVYFS